MGPHEGPLQAQVLVDRTSLELFANQGKVSASFCFLPEAWDAPLEFYATGGPVSLSSPVVRELVPAWN